MFVNTFNHIVGHIFFFLHSYLINDVVQFVLPDVRFFFQTLALKFDN